MYPKKNPSTASTPQKLGCTVAGVFQAFALEKANWISPKSHMTVILITTKLAASPASPAKTLSVLLLAWEGGQTIALPLVLAVVSEDGRGSKILSELSRQVPGRQLCCRRPVWLQQPQPSFAGFYSLCPIFSHSEHTHPCTYMLTQAGTWPLEASPQLRRGNRGWCGLKATCLRQQTSESQLLHWSALHLIWGLLSFFQKWR